MTEVKLNWKSLKFWPDTGKIYFTYSDIEKWPEWPEGPLVEIIDGELYMVPSPIVFHQDILRRLFVCLTRHVQENNLGIVYSAPLDVVFSERDVVDPDLFYISHARAGIVQEKNIQGAPDFIIEILSENRNRDLVDKKALYEQYGVFEYWIIDPVNLTVTVFVLDPEHQTYPEGVEYSRDDLITSQTLPEFTINVSSIFQD